MIPVYEILDVYESLFGQEVKCEMFAFKRPGGHTCFHLEGSTQVYLAIFHSFTGDCILENKNGEKEQGYGPTAGEMPAEDITGG